MKIVKLRGIDRLIPKLIYRLDKIGFKIRSKLILRISYKLIEYIRIKYKAPDNRKWLLGMDYIKF